jgi:hypothetical protein
MFKDCQTFCYKKKYNPSCSSQYTLEEKEVTYHKRVVYTAIVIAQRTMGK